MHTKTGIWEFDHREEPQFGPLIDGRDVFLFTVVDRESFFILNMRVIVKGKDEGPLDVLTQAIAKHERIPDVLLIKDERLVEILQPAAIEFGFEIKVVKKFRAIPQIMRDLKKTLGRRPVEFVPDPDMAPEDMLFDDCEICQAQKAAMMEGRELTVDEMKAAFKRAKQSGNGIVGGVME